VRSDYHDHVAAVLLWLRLDETEFLDIAGQPLEQLVAQFGSRLLPAPEHDRHLDLVPLPKEPLDMAPLGAVVVRVNLRPNLDFLDDRLRLVLARLPGLERRLILELAEVHELAHRRPRGRRHLDEVEVCLLSKSQRVGDRDDPDLLARRAYETNFRYPDTVVDTRFSADVTSNVTLFLVRDCPRSGTPGLAVKRQSPARLACGATTGDGRSALGAYSPAARTTSPRTPQRRPANGTPGRDVRPCPPSLSAGRTSTRRRSRRPRGRRCADQVGGGRGGPPLAARRNPPSRYVLLASLAHLAGTVAVARCRIPCGLPQTFSL
jgi:hypothetical protein